MAKPKLSVQVYPISVPYQGRMVRQWCIEVSCDEAMVTCGYGYASPTKDYDEFDVDVFKVTTSVPNFRSAYFFPNALKFNTALKPARITTFLVKLSVQRYLSARRKLIASKTVDAVAS